MPYQARRIPTYRHYRPKDLAVVRIDGRDHYLGKYDSPESRERYHRLIAEWLAAPGRSASASRPVPDAPPVRLRINDLMLAYWRHAEVHYRGPSGKPTHELDNMRDASALCASSTATPRPPGSDQWPCVRSSRR